MGREIYIELGEAGVAEQFGGIESGLLRELCGSGEDQSLIAGFVISGSGRAGAGLRNDDATPVDEADDGGLVKNVLIVAGEEKDAIAAERASEGEAELMLLAGGLEVEEGIAGVEGAVAEVIESGAVKFVGAGFGDDVDDGAAGASGFGGNRNSGRRGIPG